MLRIRPQTGSRLRTYAITAVCVVGGFAVVALVVTATGGSLQAAISGWARGAFGTPYAAVQTIAYAVPLVLIALGVSPALRAGVIAVGAEGQMITGGIAATATVLALPRQTAAVLALPGGALAGMLAGAAWSMVAAVPLLRWRVNEILSALMANYLAVQLLTYLLRTSLADPEGYSTPRSAGLPPAGRIPFLPVPGRLTAGAIVVVALLAAGIWWHRTRAARILDIFAEDRWLASRLGLTPTRAILGSVATSGATAGLAGWLQVAGPDGRLAPGIAGGIAFTGLVVAVLGRNRPVPILLAGLLIASLTTGANGIQLLSATPAAIGVVTQGVLLLAVALAIALSQRARTRRGATHG
jgi:simple sugar transport system permease protein